jgi:hypothetical protein
MKRQSRPFVVEVKRTRKSLTNIWGSSSILEDAAAPVQRPERISADLGNIFKRPTAASTERSDNAAPMPRVLPSLLTEAAPIEAHEDQAAPRRPVARRATRKPEIERQSAPLADLWSEHRSERSVGPNMAQLGAPVPVMAEANLADHDERAAHKAIAEDLFAGLRTAVPVAAPEPEAEPKPIRRRRRQPQARGTTTSPLPLEDLDETFEAELADDIEAKALAEPAPRREVRISRRKGQASFPPGQRWKRRLPSSLR